ncbi:hypothetical protein KUCAC02_015114, partial [Chaenocephalus aceratus]
SNLRLHKIASNNAEVMRAFPGEDLAKGLQDFDIGQDSPPMQHSLGLGWDLSTDTFAFRVTASDKPSTRRGVLSTINSLFDPLRFAAPVSIQGRIILRELMTDGCEWDAPLPKEKLEEWLRWKNSMEDLQGLKIPRMYTSLLFSGAHKKEVCVFCDASTKAIASQLALSSWLVGLTFLTNPQPYQPDKEAFDLINAGTDVEVRPEVTVCTTRLSDNKLSGARFERFS